MASPRRRVFEVDSLYVWHPSTSRYAVQVQQNESVTSTVTLYGGWDPESEDLVNDWVQLSQATLTDKSIQQLFSDGTDPIFLSVWPALKIDVQGGTNTVQVATRIVEF